ncbi:MAG: hypothetical protein WB949_10080 [Candidatus Acidiferrales bacterium]
MKAPNAYGPVLFVLGLDVLLNLPANTEVLVTKDNPTRWHAGQPYTEQWFQTPDELAACIKLGDFGKMAVIRIPGGKLDFPHRQAEIVLDDPRMHVSSGDDAYAFAERRLREAATASGTAVQISKRACGPDCCCGEKYARFAPSQVDFWFK